MDLLADGERYPAAAILIVDDEPGNLIAYEAVLAALGHTIVKARSGAEALARAAERTFALALIDVHMPGGLDGFETLRRLRGLEQARATPMLMITGYTDSTSHVHQAYAAGALDYITKPVDPDLLRWKAASLVLLYQRGEMLKRRALEVAIADSARRAAEERLQQQRFLADASRRLVDASADPEGTLADLARMAVPVFADWCRVDLLEAGGGVKRIAEHRAAHLPEGALDPGDWNRARAVIESGAPELVRSCLIVPMVARGGTLGAITLARAEPSRPFQELDLALALELGSLAGLALENARLYRLAERNAAAREEMLAIVSHDLQNPLSAMLIKAEMMQRLIEPVEANLRLRRGVEGILRAGKQMSELLRMLLDATAIERGRLRVNADACDPGGLVREAADLLAPLAAQKTVNLAVETPPDLPAVRADRSRLFQVLSNLVGNAIKYTAPGGRVTVQADRSDGVIAFRVVDTGAGIAPEHLPRLFERDWQVTRRRDGLGLGLYIARGIVEAHGGTIEVDSAPDRGSTFRFTVPLA